MNPVIGLILITLALMFVPKSGLADSRLHSETISVSNGHSIQYHLKRNATDSPSNNLLLILQGSDCNSVANHPSLLDMFSGIAPESDVLLIEKAGITDSLPYSLAIERPDCPQAYLKHDHPSLRVSNAKAVLQHIDVKTVYEKVIVAGGSEGATVTAMLATDTALVDAAILFNGGGRWFIDDVKHSISSAIPDENARREALAEFEGFANFIIDADQADVVVSGHGQRWWREMLSLDQAKVISAIEVPVLMVKSARDKSVSPLEAQELTEFLQQQRKSNIDVVTYADLDHYFRDETGRDFRREVISDMNEWLVREME